MMRFRSWRMACCVAVLYCAGARADYIVASYLSPTQSMNFSFDFDVDQFDPALGTLTNIEFRLTGGLIADIGLENTTLGASNIVSVYLPADYALRRQSDNFLFVSAFPTSGVFDLLLDPFDGNLDFQPPSGRTFEEVLGLHLSFKSFLDSQLISDFTGSGAVALRLALAMGVLNVSGESGKLQEGATNNERGFGELELVFWYEPIPEPNALMLLLAGAGAIFLVRRRRAS